MIKSLIRLANHLDKIGLTKEADFIDNVLNEEQIYTDSNEESSSILFDPDEILNTSDFLLQGFNLKDPLGEELDKIINYMKSEDGLGHINDEIKLVDSKNLLTDYGIRLMDRAKERVGEL